MLDLITLDVEPELPQDRKVDIQAVERIALRFTRGVSALPETLALRADFPRNLPHTNVVPLGFSFVSLCLYEEPFRELQYSWTPAAHIRRIHEWLKLSALGTLHPSDQPLEPFLLGVTSSIVVAEDLLQESATPIDLTISCVESGSSLTLFAWRGRPQNSKSGHFELFLVRAKPDAGGAPRWAPSTMKELHECLSALGVNLIGALRDWTKSLDGQRLSARLVVMVLFPRLRSGSTRVELEEVWSFMTSQTLAEIGENLGIWKRDSSGVLAALVPIDEGIQGESTILLALRPVLSFSAERAALLSGHPVSKTASVMLGVGALGSQVLGNLVREGTGRWTAVDEDVLLPHNLARHLLGGESVGQPKAAAVAEFLTRIFDGDEPVKGIVADVMSDQRSDEFEVALSTADLIVDATASAVVSRHVAIDLGSSARRLALFLTDGGSDLVLLQEDRTRSTRLDDLEMQLYRAAIRVPQIEGLLRKRADLVRYGRSCGDVTARISQSTLALSGAIGATAVRESGSDSEARIRVWRLRANRSVECVEIPVSPVLELERKDWAMRVCRALEEELFELRQARLPNETGGALLGHHDIHRRIVYVVAALPAPQDSKERPFYFERGASGLRAAVEAIELDTARSLTYVGEWHSHPDGSGVAPSQADKRVFEWLGSRMTVEEIPPLMFIVGSEEIGYYWDELD